MGDAPAMGLEIMRVLDTSEKGNGWRSCMTFEAALGATPLGYTGLASSAPRALIETPIL